MTSCLKGLLTHPLILIILLGLLGCGDSNLGSKSGTLNVNLSIGTPWEIGPDVLCNPPLIDLDFDPLEHVEAIQAELRKRTFVEEFDEDSRRLRFEIDPLSITNLLFYDHAFICQPILDSGGSQIVPTTTNDIVKAHLKTSMAIDELPRFYRRLKAHPPRCHLRISVPGKILKYSLKEGDAAPPSVDGVTLSDLRFNQDHCSIKFSSSGVEDRVVMVGRNAKGETLLPLTTSQIRFNDDIPDFGQDFKGRVAEVDLYVLLNPSQLDIPYEINLDPRFPDEPTADVTTRLEPPPQGWSRSHNILTSEEIDQLEVGVRKSSSRWRFEVGGTREDILGCHWTEIEVKINGDWRSASRQFSSMSFPLEQELEGGVVERLQRVKGKVTVPYFLQEEVVVVERNGRTDVVTPVHTDGEAQITSRFHHNTLRTTIESGSGCRIIKTQCFNADGLEIMAGPRGGRYWGVPETVRYTVLTGKDTVTLPFDLKTK